MPALALACAPGKTSSWTHCPDWSKISSVTCDDYHYYDFEEKKMIVILKKKMIVILMIIIVTIVMIHNFFSMIKNL